MFTFSCGEFSRTAERFRVCWIRRKSLDGSCRKNSRRNRRSFQQCFVSWKSKEIEWAHRRGWLGRKLDLEEIETSRVLSLSLSFSFPAPSSIPACISICREALNGTEPTYLSHVSKILLGFCLLPITIYMFTIISLLFFFYICYLVADNALEKSVVPSKSKRSKIEKEIRNKKRRREKRLVKEPAVTDSTRMLNFWFWVKFFGDFFRRRPGRLPFIFMFANVLTPYKVDVGILTLTVDASDNSFRILLFATRRSRLMKLFFLSFFSVSSSFIYIFLSEFDRLVSNKKED